MTNGFHNYRLTYVYYNPSLCSLLEIEEDFDGTLVNLQAYIDDVMVHGAWAESQPGIWTIPGYEWADYARAAPSIIYGVLVKDNGAITPAITSVMGAKSILSRLETFSKAILEAFKNLLKQSPPRPIGKQ
jgi:hypothetical protein